MRLRRLRHARLAAWLGVVALALNALVPVHLAFDLDEALAPPHECGAGIGHDLEWRVLAVLSGHLAPAPTHPPAHGKHHRPDCPVCSALGSLAGLTPSAPPMLSQPAPAVPAFAFVAVARHDAAPAVGYRSRAPPFA